MTTEPKETAPARGAVVSLRLFAGMCFASALVLLDWNRGHAPSSAMAAAIYGLPYLFVLFHPERWRAPAIGVALGFPLAAVPFALLLRILARDQQTSIIVFVAMNVVLLGIALAAWVVERARLRAALIISFALCAWLF